MKKWSYRYIILLAFLLSFTAVFAQPYVVMLSMDGFRWDYAEHARTPNLDRIAEMGIKAHSLIPAFPTKTFPNHYTMATGLYPDHHGIVQNSFYDPETERSYKVSDRAAVEDGSFYGGEPIWVTAEKQGIRTASFFWVGSEAPVKGIQSAHWKKYQEDIPFEARIDTVVAWLSLPEQQRPHLILWYYHEPDETGHSEGPLSEEIIQQVEYLDRMLGIFLDRMEQLPIASEVNLIFTSDHGMGPVNTKFTVNLNDYIDKDWFTHVEGGSPNYTFKVKAPYYDTAWAQLSRIPHVSVWKHGEVPLRFNYGQNPRTLDFIMVADSAWQIAYRKRKAYSGGAHGYDNANTDMHAIFYAMGPAFQKKPDYPSFYNTDLYILIATILGLDPAPTDGSIERIKGMLK